MVRKRESAWINRTMLKGLSGSSQGSGRHFIFRERGLMPSVATCVIVRTSRKLPGINCSVVSEMTTAVCENPGGAF